MIKSAAMKMKIAVVGNGGWGTANALLLDGYGHEVTVWGHDRGYVEECRRTRRNERYLKGVDLPQTLRLTTDREESFRVSCLRLPRHLACLAVLLPACPPHSALRITHC